MTGSFSEILTYSFLRHWSWFEAFLLFAHERCWWGVFEMRVAYLHITVMAADPFKAEYPHIVFAVGSPLAFERRVAYLGPVVAIGNLKRHVRKALHRDSKQQ